MIMMVALDGKNTSATFTASTKTNTTPSWNSTSKTPMNSKISTDNTTERRQSSRPPTPTKTKKLDENEYANFYNPGHSPEQTNNAISLAMKAVDSDNDGQLSLTEYLNDFKNPSYKGDDDWMETEKDIFKDMDMSDDGFLNGDELVLWIQQDNGEIAVDEAIHLIETADKDEDGKLSHAEVMEAMEDFIESDATEYGFMLKHDEL